MHQEIRTTDAKARLVLPKLFANATVIVEQISDSEVRIRRAKVIAEDELSSGMRLSDQDRDRFFELLENPPAPNAALQAAGKKYKARHG